MNEYTPDGWVILKVKMGQYNLYKVFGTWSGGFLEGPSWRINSGITSVREEDGCYKLYGYSGSVYNCHSYNEGVIDIHNGRVLSNYLENNINDRVVTFSEFKEEFCL